MIWVALLLTASLAPPSVASSDGQPPVTIIEIPVTTSTTPASLVLPPATSVPTTSPTSATSSPLVEDQVSSPPVGPPLWLWVVGVVLTVGGFLLQELVRLRRNRRTTSGAPATPMPTPDPVISPSALPLYEAVEYRSELGTSEVQPHTLGKFETLEAAIEAARLARSGFVLDSQTEAFWVVWNLPLMRAAWVAESDTPEERVIDLRAGRRQPHSAESNQK